MFSKVLKIITRKDDYNSVFKTKTSDIIVTSPCISISLFDDVYSEYSAVKDEHDINTILEYYLNLNILH